MRSFLAKLVVLLVVVLVVPTTATWLLVHFAGQRTVGNSIAEELRVGRRILENILAGRGRQLSETVRVLASDFAFREAIASGDQPTINSVLANHAARIYTDAAMLISLDGSLVADTLKGRLTGRSFPLPALMRRAEERGEASAIVTLDGHPYQLVIVPVMAPRPIAWVCMGFRIDARVLDEFKRLTDLDISLWNARANDPLLISTLPRQHRTELLARAQALSLRSGDREQTLAIGSTEYQALIHPLRTDDNSRVYTLVQRSIEDAAAPYRRLKMQIIGGSAAALLFTLVVAIFLARGFTRPLAQLSVEAQRIQAGDYARPIAIRQRDEIGKLATAFDRMRTGIAEREEQIRHQASHDGLTGLPNRTLFLDCLRKAIAARREGETVAMIIMDLDRFKAINDTLGHRFGDRLLVEIGRRLQGTLHETNTVSRLGGDEFAATFTMRDGSGAVAIAERILEALVMPFVVDGAPIAVNASMGIALCPQHGEDAETLLQHADVAMYDAKKTHAAYAIYETGRDENTKRRLAILTGLRQAIARDELELHYQPKIDIHSGRVVHAEALVRWQHPEHKSLRPDEFIPLAEHSGDINMLTRWVLRHAIAECGAWNAAGLDLSIAVNLSALDLVDDALPVLVGDLLSEVGLAPSKLVLEITETAVMTDPAAALKILRDLKSRGVMLALDDYGAGHSSLAHLGRLPIDELKIDKSFVIGLGNGAKDDVVIVRSTIELGHNIGLKVIAEGVESEAAWEILKDLGCDMAQGFYVSRPLPAGEFLQWVRESPWGLASPAS